MIKQLLLSVLLTHIVLCSHAQQNNFKLEKITFLSSECFGTCPQISMTIYEDRRIELSRRIYKSKGGVDTSVSKNYKGLLDQKKFDTLLELIKQQAWDTLKFPDVLCCDGRIITFFVYYNGKYKRLTSMIPPQQVRPLIKYLTSLGITIQLPVYDKPIEFERWTEKPS